MSRTRTLTALATLGAFLVIGIGTAQADNGAGSAGGSNSSVVSNWGSGNLVGSVSGNGNAAQQTATGAGGSNQNNTTGVAGNAGGVAAVQGNVNYLHLVHFPIAG